VKTKSKVLAKLIAAILAVVMVFTSAVPAFAAGYGAHRADKAATVGKNWVDWVELLNDDACEALLDGADEFLKDLDLTHLASRGTLDKKYTFPVHMDLNSSVNDMLNDGGKIELYLGNQTRANGKYPTGGTNSDSFSNNSETSTAPGQHRVYLYVKLSASVLITINRTFKVEGYVDSVDGIIDLLCQLYNNIINSDLMYQSAFIANVDILDKVGGSQVTDLRNSLSLLGTGKGKLYNSSMYTSTTETSKCGKSWRKKLGAKQTMKYIAQLLDELINRQNSNNIIYNILNGTFSLGNLNGMVGLYYKDADTAQQARNKGIIGKLVTGEKAPIWNEYETNGYLLYNGLAAWVMNHELPTTDGNVKAYYGIDEDGNKLYTVPTGEITGNNSRLTAGKYKLYGSSTATAWNYDKVICDCISRYVLQYINVNVTYPEYIYVKDGEEVPIETVGGKWVHDNSQARYKRGDTDPNLKYNADGNVYIFRYGNDRLWLKDTSNLRDFAFEALKMAWKTCLKPTLHLVQINYNGHEVDNIGTNFDNAFLQWYIEKKATGTVRTFNATDAYKEATVNEWAADVCDDYGVDADTFIANVKKTYDYDEERKAENDAYNWRDLEVTTLWNMVRYSPLADKVFNIRTGPANLYLLQTGASKIDEFMDAVCAGTKTYAGIPEALNDFLIAALKDIFPDSANIYKNDYANDNAAVAVSRPNDATASSTFDAGCSCIVRT